MCVHYIKIMQVLCTLLQINLKNIHITHRGCHINTVLPVSQDCEYISRKGCYTYGRAIAARQLTEVGSSIGCCGCCLQHEGTKVEKQSNEMVKHVLEKRRGNELEGNTKKFKSVRFQA